MNDYGFFWKLDIKMRKMKTPVPAHLLYSKAHKQITFDTLRWTPCIFPIWRYGTIQGHTGLYTAPNALQFFEFCTDSSKNNGGFPWLWQYFVLYCSNYALNKLKNVTVGIKSLLTTLKNIFFMTFRACSKISLRNPIHHQSVHDMGWLSIYPSTCPQQ